MKVFLVICLCLLALTQARPQYRSDEAELEALKKDTDQQLAKRQYYPQPFISAHSPGSRFLREESSKKDNTENDDDMDIPADQELVHHSLEETKLKKRWLNWRKLAGNAATVLRKLQRFLREERSIEDDNSPEESNKDAWMMVPYDNDFKNDDMKAKTASKRFFLPTGIIKPLIDKGANWLDRWSKGQRRSVSVSKKSEKWLESTVLYEL